MADYKTATIDKKYFGALVQYPNDKGSIEDYRSFINKVHDAEAFVVMTTDLLALTLLTPPGELGADVACGSAQRFGVPLGLVVRMLRSLQPKTNSNAIFPAVLSV